MLKLALLAALSLYAYLYLKRILDRSVAIKREDCRRLESEYGKLGEENTGLKKDNTSLEESVQETIALYDITKDICKSLREDKVIGFFQEKLDRYLKKGRCVFIKGHTDISLHKDCTVFPLTIHDQLIGYLVASNINAEDRERFYILASQFLSVIKRVLLYQKVQGLTIVDTLTQVFNRRHFLERFAEEMRRSQNFNLSMSFAMIDIDKFKEFNDHYGHLVGDVILREIAKTIKETIRQIDFIGRYGGEEIAVALVETDKEQARLAAERIREAIEAKVIAAYDEQLKVTVSLGVATFPEDAKEEQALIDKADEALYKAKEAGRNRVVLY
ncbi:MAG TPA: GGDEF domain-containing protein [Candidatus Margulisiibacteriota bacterium]|nr:GGDEF domain-containing protein [Candidatus Margulisiibacteriota bacterium]